MIWNDISKEILGHPGMIVPEEPEPRHWPSPVILEPEVTWGNFRVHGHLLLQQTETHATLSFSKSDL